jgi:chitinase
MQFKSYIALVLVITFVVPYTVDAGLLLGKRDREKLAEKQEQAADSSERRDIDGPWVLTYYVGYQNGYLKPRDVDFTAMTHIVVGGVGINADGTLDEHWHLSDGDGRDMARDVGRRADREDVRKLIWLGGPNEEGKLFAASSDAVRPTTVRNILELVDELNYDGVDIDWEPIRKQDEPRILALVKDLREARPNLIITVPVNWVPTTILTTKDLSLYPELAKYADRLFIMSYSMAGPWPGWKSWHGGARTGDSLQTPGSIRSSLLAYRLAGVPKEKLGLGIGTYATCWEYPVRTHGQDIPRTFGSRDIHVMSMHTMYEEYYQRRYERYDSGADVPYLSFPTGVGDFSCGFISYENVKSVRAKARYAKGLDLGGVLIWNIGTGYNRTGSKSKRHELIRAVYRTVRR